jgi:hypothetical protein
MLMLREHLPRSESATGGRLCHALNRGLRSCAREDLGKYHGGQRYKRPTLRCYQKHVISNVFGDCYYHAVKGHSSMSGAMCVLKVGLRHGTT